MIARHEKLSHKTAKTKRTAKHRTDAPALPAANRKRQIHDDSRNLAGGMTGGDFVPLRSSDLVPLPDGSQLFFISRGLPVGFTSAGLPVMIDGVSPVSAFLPPGYTRTYLRGTWSIQAERSRRIGPGDPLREER